ncbi:MAG: N-acetylglucosamine-6-phosphate deacetylase, partial [Kineosporiaceae bacterium]
GIHLEGSWLSPRRPGAHDRAALRPPDVDEVRTLLGAGRGTIRMVTLAPELPGAVAAIRLLTDAGVVAAVGHTDATYAQTRTAIAAGARVGTHLFNAMRPIEHREPGPVTALAEDPAVTLELILDGVHLHPAVYGLVSRWVGEGRIALVTDATAAAGMPDGDYTLGSLRVTVTRGVATVSGTQTLAGGTATMDRLFREAVRLRSDVPYDRVPDDRVPDDALLHAVRETSLVPARALGLGARDLSPGSPADLVVLAPDLTPERVIVSGVVVGP